MLRSIILIAMCVQLSGCFVGVTPGEDSAGRKLQSQFAPVVIAIGQYMQKYATLPANLKLLVPEFLARLPSNDPSTGVVYYLDGAHGTFTFMYTPSWPQPGRASCSTGIKQVKWECTGFI